MSLIISEYNENDRVEKSWYDSSNLIYSEINDNENDFKDLKVVFSDGRTYIYEKISSIDYALFKNSLSQGKAFFKYIAVKGKYEYQKLDNVEIKLLEETKKQLLEERAKSLLESELKKKPYNSKDLKEHLGFIDNNLT